jgi:mono/diheme cytochrome c family protein
MGAKMFQRGEVQLFVAALLLLAGRSVTSAEDHASATNGLKPFLAAYCTSCHGAEKQKGDRQFDTLALEISDDDLLVDYQDILDQLNLGEMPPKESRQPSTAERRKVIAWLTSSIDRYHQSRQATDHETMLRRLNSREYQNTIRDLLHLNMAMFQPTVSFPRDQTEDHLDNVGETLVTSSHLLSGYLDAADQIINKALFPLQQPAAQTWAFRDGFNQQPEIDQVHRKTNQFKHMTLYDVVGADKPEGAYGPIHAFAKGVPWDGIYELRIKAEAVNRLHPYDDDFLGTDRNEPLRLGIVPGNHKVGSLHLKQPIEPLLAEIDLADEPKWYTVRVWLDQGYTPRFTFRNGLMDARNLWSRLIRKYPDQFPKGLKGIVEMRFNAIKHGKLPQIHIDEIEIEGPLYDQWPRKSQLALLGDDWQQATGGGELSVDQMRHRVRSFASRAYRRPATDSEVTQIMQVIATRQAAGRKPVDALADGMKAILCSPSFLYLDEPGDDRLTSYALASRLSYFLWASMPDDELRSLAANDQLQTSQVLREQVGRMLDDPRSDAMIKGFLDSWLTLRELGSAPPDRGDFRAFYHYDLDAAMRRETHLFTRRLIDENLSLVHFLDSDFAIVNKRLAQLYGIDPPQQPGFHTVKLTDRRRGGLLGQASVLTVTANGIDTSPVNRGVWMLENLLGTPPSPPPADVEPLDPDVRGAKTIREQLAKHRNVATCYDCHRKIDPLGFALESFDPIGRWRDSYGRNAKVDPSGELPDGQQFEDIQGLKQILVSRKDQFARALTEKMLAYAIGRRLHPTDRPAIDGILQQLRASGYGTQDLIESIVVSEPFRSK